MTILLLSGYDPTGNAGILRDIEICKIARKKFFPVITAFTFQTDKKYLGTRISKPIYFQKCLAHVDAKKIAAVKIGMLGNHHVIGFVIRLLKKIKQQSPKIKVVWDPVFESTSGGKLLTRKGRLLAQKKLIPLVDIVTPNVPEAKLMTGSKNHDELCKKFFKLYHKPVFLKGGHLKSKSRDFFYDGKIEKILSSKPYARKIRGTGCALSTRLSCHLANGESLWRACQKTKKFMNRIFLEKQKSNWQENCSSLR